MPKVKVEYMCPECGFEFSDTPTPECPKCGTWCDGGFRSLICEECGDQVPLYYALTNECSCGALYNILGQRLAPREEWMEE